jgi:hypothetical protein
VGVGEAQQKTWKSGSRDTPKHTHWGRQLWGHKAIFTPVGSRLPTSSCGVFAMATDDVSGPRSQLEAAGNSQALDRVVGRGMGRGRGRWG